MSDEVKVKNKVKEWRTDIASTNFATLKVNMNNGNSFHSNAMKMEDAYFGRQYSVAEERELRAFRQAPIPISVSSAILDTSDAMMISAQPTIYVSPIIHPYDKQFTEESRQVAGIYKHVIHRSWYDSLGNLQLDRAIQDSSRVGHGLMYAVPRNEYGEFMVDIKHLSWRYYFPDSACKDALYRQMDNMIYAMPLSQKAAFRFVKSIEPDLTEDEFQDFIKGGISETGMFNEDIMARLGGSGKDKPVLFIQLLTIENQHQYIVIPNSNEFNTSSMEDIKYRTYTELTPELIALRDSNKIKIQTRKNQMFLTEYTSVGNYGYKVVYPISQYNIVPFIYDHRDTPYPYSLMWRLYPLQRALNKFVMSSMLNMSLLNSVRIMAEENSIINGKEWTTTASMPGVILKYRLPVPGYSQKPEIVKPSPMGDAWLSMPKYMIYLMEYISGMWGIQQGNAEGVPDVFSTVAALQSTGGTRIKRRMARNDAALSILGQVVGEFYKEYAPPNGFSSKFMNETGYDNQEDDYILYNKLETIKTENKDKKGNSKYEVKVAPNTDLQRGFKKVRFTSQASAGYEAATESAMLAQIATQLKEPALLPAILKRANIAGIDEVIKAVDSERKLKGQLEESQKLINQLEQGTKMNQNQIFQLAKSLEAAKAKGKLDVEIQKFVDKPLEYINKSANFQGEQ